MKPLAASLLLLFLCAAPAAAQNGPTQGDHELQLWTGGGHNVKGGVGGISVWNVGLRYGWILTDLHGPGILRGRFEYAVDVVPIFWLFQPTGRAYGFVVDPVALKWDFQQRRHVVPYLELSGGTLFTSRDVPPGISRVNFTSGGAAGLYFLAGKYNWSVEFRYMHISDAGLTSPNPGVNTLQARVGFGVFRNRKR